MIIATRNRGAMLAEAAESILNGQYPEIELFVVDDCSEDDTPAVVAALQESDQRVIGIRLPKRQGSVKARARGVAASAGQFAAFMDDDDIAWPNRIAAPLRHFMMYPDLDVVYAFGSDRTRAAAGRTQPSAGGLPDEVRYRCPTSFSFVGR
jgi:glycosyltransferase involved in cell wall biosynthesis